MRSVRGRGLMLACELDVPAPAGRAPCAARRSGSCVNATGATTLRLLPPLVIGPAEIDDALARLGRALEG